MDRRKFLQQGALAAAGFTILPRHVLGGKGHIAPSDKLNIACVGAGGKGWDNLQRAWNNGSDNIVSLCDVDDRQSKNAREKWPQASYYKDFRAMLEKENKNIDGVIVATPDHMHAVVALAAMQLGKHVYVQKPLTHDIYEARILTEAAKRYKVVTQMGNQGSSGDDTRKVEAWIQAGLIGDVTRVHCWTNRPVWPQGLPTPTSKFDIPKELDWDLWLGTAPFRDYHPSYLPFNWRGWVDFGTGALGDMACHIMDVPFRALHLDYPTEVECSMSTVWTGFFKEANYTDSFPPSSVIHFQFPARGHWPAVKLTWYDGGILPERPAELGPDEALGDWDGGMIFEGTKGKIMAGMWGKNATLLPSSRMQTAKLPEPTRPLVAGGANMHEQQWVQACKKGAGTPVSSPFEQAGPLTEAVLMGNLAIRSYLYREATSGGRFNYPGRKKLLWDGPSMKITNFDYANQFVKRTYRNGWSLQI